MFSLWPKFAPLAKMSAAKFAPLEMSAASRQIEAMQDELACTVCHVCITKTEKAESEAQRGKPKGTLESESRNAIE